jgi:group I intron endonuclease
MMNTGIYSISSPSGRRYIGSAINIDRRWLRHRKDLKAGKHGNRSLQRAAVKYGVENLKFEKLIICDAPLLLFYEQLAIDGLKPEYNLALIAGSTIGIKRSDEFRTKISAALRLRSVSDETRAKIGAKHKGKKLKPYQIKALAEGRARKPQSKDDLRECAKAMNTPEAKAKKALAMIGRPVSAETRAKIRKSLMGHPMSDETRAKISATKRLRAQQKSQAAVTLQAE